MYISFGFHVLSTSSDLALHMLEMLDCPLMGIDDGLLSWSVHTCIPFLLLELDSVQMHGN
jgi:hypothetical protein